MHVIEHQMPRIMHLVFASLANKNNKQLFKELSAIIIYNV
jgi:hypothetical protein